MVIDTDNLDLRDVAVKLLRRNYDWIDADPDVVWSDKLPEQRASLITWRSELIGEKMQELRSVIEAIELSSTSTDAKENPE